MTGQRGDTRPVESGILIGIIDTLSSASILNDAIYMAAGSLDDMQKDAMQVLTTHVERTIEVAKKELLTLLEQGKSAEGNGNG